MAAYTPGGYQPVMGADGYGGGDTFPQDYPMPAYNDNSAAIGRGLGMDLSNLSPMNMVYDPFQFQRPQYMDMLSRLAQDPSSITTTPWYNAGIESVKRGMSKGYLDSGNMALALSQYGQDQYYKQIAMLSQLAGGGMGATNVGGSIVGAKGVGADLQSKALGTQRYQDLQRLLQQSQGGGGNSRPFWGPPDVGGTKLPPYQGGGGGRGGQPQRPDQQQPDQNSDWQKEMEDTFGMPFDEIMNMMYGNNPNATPGGGGQMPNGQGVPGEYDGSGDNTDYNDIFGDYSGGDEGGD